MHLQSWLLDCGSGVNKLFIAQSILQLSQAVWHLVTRQVNTTAHDEIHLDSYTFIGTAIAKVWDNTITMLSNKTHRKMLLQFWQNF